MKIYFWLELNGPQILGRLTTTATPTSSGAIPLDIDQFKVEYEKMLLTAQQRKEKKRVLFDLTHGYSMTLFLNVKQTLQDYFQVQIKDLSESVVDKCIVVIPDPAIGKLIQGIIALVSSPIPTYIRSTMPGKK